MASYTLRGNQLVSLLENFESTVEIKKDGTATGSLKYTGKWPGAVAQAMALVFHPDFPWLKRETIRVSREEAEFAIVKITYGGAKTENDEIQRTYTLKAGTSAEPIETHWNFVVFGGLPPNGKAGTNAKGATFDDKGAFKGFAVEDDANGLNYYPNENKDKAGVRSYLAPAVTYKEVATYPKSRRSEAADLIRNVGITSVQTPPDTDFLPNLGGDYTWLLVDMEATEVGEGIRLTRTWRLSGPRGWDLDIYVDRR